MTSVPVESILLLPTPRSIISLTGCYVLPHRFLLAASDKLIELFNDLRSPDPRQLSVLGPRALLKAEANQEANLIIELEPNKVPTPAGYTLDIQSNVVRIQAHDLAGAFYAIMTFRQAIRQVNSSDALPCMSIHDGPELKHRGVMLDISRNKVPQMQTLYSLVDMLTEWKYNQLQLYTEHTFAYKNHEEVWKEASPMTAKQIRALDAYCQKRFMQLIPNQNSFGHLKPWLIHSRYRMLAEAPEGCQTKWGHQEGPFSLCPIDPGSIALLSEWYKELLPNFSSNSFNVGCDETVDLGQGRSQEACAERGLGRVYLDFLLQIHALVKEHGKTMQFWADIIKQHPDLIPEVPKDVLALEWGYESDYDFTENVNRLKQSQIPFYVCPGTSTWNSIGGRTENACLNIKHAAIAAKEYDAQGLLLTDWGDHGHWQHWPVSLLGYAYAAALSWSPDDNLALDLKKALNIHVFLDKSSKLGPWLYDLGNVYQSIGIKPFNASGLFKLLYYHQDPIKGKKGQLKGLKLKALKKTLSNIQQQIDELSAIQLNRTDGQLILDECKNAALLLEHACLLGVARLESENSNAIAHLSREQKDALSVHLAPVISEYKRVWLQRNRVGGLTNSVSAFERLLNVYGEG